MQERTIRWGHLNNTDHPVSFGVQKFAEVLAAKSGGKLKVREFPASQLGNEMQQQSAVRGGTQEILSASTTSLASVVKDLGLFDFPFIVSTFEQAEALAQGAFGKAMLETLPEKELIGLGYWGLGFRNATNSSRPIAKVEDFAGLKLRVIPNPVYLETFKALKANPVPMAFGELYTALENKTVDGQENPFSVILSNKFYEVQKYVSATNHTFTQNIIIVSKKFWDGLSRGRAEDAARQLCRDARVPARPDQARGGQGARRTEGQGHAVQRDRAGRTRPHAGRDQAGRRKILGRIRSGAGKTLQRRAGAHPRQHEVSRRELRWPPSNG